MADLDLNGMSLAELKKLQKNISKAIDGYSDRKKLEAKSALEAHAQELGFTLAELVGGKKMRKSSVPMPKYQHPANPEITWSGRGRKPGWFKDVIAAGKTPESMEV